MTGYAGRQKTVRRWCDRTGTSSVLPPAGRESAVPRRASVRRRLAGVGIGLSVGAIVLLSGCAADAEPETTADASSAPSVDASAPAPTPPPSPSAAAAPEGIDTSDWLDFATVDGTVAFRYPADWTLASESVDFQPDAGRDDVEDPNQRFYDSATLTAPNGQELLHLADFADLGGSCGYLPPQELILLASEPSSVQRTDGADETVIATVALQHPDGRWRMGIGLADAGSLPSPEGELGCTVHYFTFGSSDGGTFMGTDPQLDTSGEDQLWDVATLDDARAYMETEEYATIVEILRSVEVA